MSVKSCTEMKTSKVVVTWEQKQKIDACVEKICGTWKVSRDTFNCISGTIFSIIDQIVEKERQISQIKREELVIRGNIAQGDKDLEIRSESVEAKIAVAQKKVKDLTEALASLQNAAHIAKEEKEKAATAHHNAQTAKNQNPSSSVKTRLNAQLPILAQAKSRTQVAYQQALENVKKGTAVLTKANRSLALVRENEARMTELKKTAEAANVKWRDIVKERNVLQDSVNTVVDCFIEEHIATDKREQLRANIKQTFLSMGSCRNVVLLSGSD